MKEIFWLGRSLEALKSFPDAVQDEMGYALHCAQMGETHSSTKLFKGYGSGIYEIVSDFNTDTFRAVYVVNIDESLYVLHAFQKKLNPALKHLNLIST